ncbi:uncharacterized protein LOC131333547 [Rhododendron vialii]|uniref:uncharacterized protein LOC131333547 n=1 Tax=Rhododendron vialii TaxID=182163 RepID=UPI0026603968|nr:uncharacterized protein LOC131333547 [Rhododendron vialii]XP_058224112.1 uncharacterized protein LOC131333547 [Rhododendron vialii]XP_058224121.1 uncharacterized protein LOC131333547 [Rhododendron vialii]XP_058224127.1 uncharacterized protein LOC131333547 [Rhododendron vialii]
MEKTSSPTTTTTASSSDEGGVGMGMGSETLSRVAGIIQSSEDSNIIPPQFDSKYFHSHLIRGLLRTHRVERGRLSSLLSVKPPVMNSYGTLHGGAVASVAEIMSIACARTIVGEDKELFLGELSTTYLSAAPRNAELTVDASVIRSGRSLTIIAVEFKVKDTGNLVYTSHATFYNTPVASL